MGVEKKDNRGVCPRLFSRVPPPHLLPRDSRVLWTKRAHTRVRHPCPQSAPLPSLFPTSPCPFSPSPHPPPPSPSSSKFWTGILRRCGDTHWRVVTKRCGEARRPETSSLSSRQSLCWWRRLCHDRFVTWLSLDVQGALRPTHHLRQTTCCAPFPKETMPSTMCHSPARPRNRALVKVLVGAGLAARGVLSAALPFSRYSGRATWQPREYCILRCATHDESI